MLLASVHDVAPPTLAEARRLRGALAMWGVSRATLLVVPHYHDAPRTTACPATRAWLRERAREGDEIAVHGWTHRQHARPTGVLDRARARLMSRGEAELLSLPESRVESALREARDELEDLIGDRVRGFVAPCWLEPRRFTDVLRRCGFAWHEGALWIERLGDRPEDDRRFLSPVLGFAGGGRARQALSAAWVEAFSLVASGARGPRRLALHPVDVRSPRVLGLARRAILRLRARTAPATYRELPGAAGPARVGSDR